MKVNGKDDIPYMKCKKIPVMFETSNLGSAMWCTGSRPQNFCRVTAMVDEKDTRSSWSPVPAGFTREVEKRFNRKKTKDWEIKKPYINDNDKQI